MTALVLQQYLDFAYIVAVVLFILSLKFLSSPASARWGVLAGEIGAAMAVVVTLFNPEVRPLQVGAYPADHRRRSGCSPGPGADDGRPATDGLEPRLWRAFGSHDRNCRVLRGHALQSLKL